MKYDYKGILSTIIFHVILLVLFIILGFSTPLPLPAEEGMFINFGDSPTGLGEMETATRQTNESYSEPEESSPASSPDDAVMTQDHEEAPAVKAPENKSVTKNEKKDVKKTDTKKTSTQKQTETKKTEPQPNPAASYASRFKNKKKGSEGITSGSGNQGSPTGDPNATDRTLGTGGGGGISADVAGRTMVYVSKPVLTQQKEGIVVVEVKVDREGRVTSAVPGKRGTTTPDSYLHGLAKSAALKTKFDKKSDAPFEQVGYIKYHFKLVSK